jgi:hypothetical protein
MSGERSDAIWRKEEAEKELLLSRRAHLLDSRGGSPILEPGPHMNKYEFAELLSDKLSRHTTTSQFKEFLDKAWEKRLIEDANLRQKRETQQRRADFSRDEQKYRGYAHTLAQAARNEAETVRREKKRLEDVQYEGLDGDGLGGLGPRDLRDDDGLPPNTIYGRQTHKNLVSRMNRMTHHDSVF